MLVQLLFYSCGVVFPALAVPEQWRHVFFLNPIAQIIEDLRHAVVTPDAPWTISLVGSIAYVVPIGLTLLLFIAGLTVFRRLAPAFAESL